MKSMDVMKAALLAGAALLVALPAQAQNWRGGARQERGERVERSEWRGPQRAQGQGQPQGNWGARRDFREPVQPAQAERERGDMPMEPNWSRNGGTPPQPAAAPPVRSYGADRSVTYTAPRDSSYGANARARDWQAERQAREASSQPGQPGGWAPPADRSAGYRGWNRGTVSQSDAARADWRRDRREDRREDWREDRRDDARNYVRGYRDGVRADNRFGRDYRIWDRNLWRNDRRYDWYPYRAANRSIFRLGRYYAPYRDYSYSRISIGFRLGSLFYSERYWINDPWRYRLPDAYGPYRWVRYYDDALLVDIYSGEVVDVIYGFFW